MLPKTFTRFTQADAALSAVIAPSSEILLVASSTTNTRVCSKRPVEQEGHRAALLRLYYPQEQVFFVVGSRLVHARLAQIEVGAHGALVPYSYYTLGAPVTESVAVHHPAVWVLCSGLLY